MVFFSEILLLKRFQADIKLFPGVRSTFHYSLLIKCDLQSTKFVMRKPIFLCLKLNVVLKSYFNLSVTIGFTFQLRSRTEKP